jgi:excinuclease ABC subunit A
VKLWISCETGGGGRLVAAGTPEEVAKCGESYTGKYLKKVL